VFLKILFIGQNTEYLYPLSAPMLLVALKHNVFNQKNHIKATKHTYKPAFFLKYA